VNARECLEDIGIDGRITLKWIIKKWGRRMWNVFNWLRTLKRQAV
jgi:hypothetical protein